jgi:hypothetical protein
MELSDKFLLVLAVVLDFILLFVGLFIVWLFKDKG